MAKNEKPEIKAETKTSQIHSGKTHLPVFLEVTYTFAWLITLLTGLIAAALSLLVGCTFDVIILRAGIAILTTGLLSVFIVWLISRGTVETVTRLNGATPSYSDGVISTREKKA
jgi:hypothetical protein